MHKVRIDRPPRAPGWQVRTGKEVPNLKSKWFSDRKHGGSEGAERAAAEFIEGLQAVKAEATVPGISLQWRKGVRGLAYATARVRHRDAQGKVRNTSRSLSLNGPEQGLAEAVALLGLTLGAQVRAVALLMADYREMERARVDAERVERAAAKKRGAEGPAA